MSGIKRNLHYWGYVLAKPFFFALLVVGICVAVFFSERGVPGLKRGVSIVFPPYGMFMMCVQGYLGVNQHFPFSLFMGSTRKDSFIGMELMLHTVSAIWLLISVAAVLLIYGRAEGTWIMLAVIFSFCSAGLYNIIGIVTLSVSRWAGGILYMILTITGMVGGMLVLLKAEEKALSGLMAGTMIPAAIVFDLATIILYFRVRNKIDIWA